MQAVITAAGMGRNLRELTSDKTKCMVKIGDRTIIERTLRILDEKGLSRIVMITGYQAEGLENFVKSLGIKTKMEFVRNERYETTNNVYSLSLAGELLLQDDSIILESDSVFESAVIDRLLDDEYPNLALVAKPEIWMNSAAVLLDEDDNIIRFVSPKHFRYGDGLDYYKTANMYKFGKEFLKTEYVPFLLAYANAFGRSSGYESLLRVIAFQEKPLIKARKLVSEKWYEINDIQDVDIAETIFAGGIDKYKKYIRRFGGYWRYPGMHDFCYLVNPYFPNARFMDEMRSRFETLIREYPSGMNVNSLLAGKFFGVRPENIVVGNGTSELIKSLVEQVPSMQGKLGMIYPTFEEYPHRKKNEEEEVVPFPGMGEDFKYDADSLMRFYQDKDIAALVLINPDNPSGHFISRADLIRMADWAEMKGCRLVVDESFVDFADVPEKTTLLDQFVLDFHPNLIVIKSIAKSFGVPGLRLGVLASGDKDLIAFMKKDVAIWNINSFGEYFMQIIEKYKGDYEAAMQRFMGVRSRFMVGLYAVQGLKVYPTQANYVLARIETGMTSGELADILLNRYNILIKDLSTKTGFEGGNYIRLSVKTDEENNYLLKALNEVL
ncbi:MAG: aminotransferase class I/II-fold pyridoxal phosphate-dependent enzyme [Lachnospiraceae bacterium]|nr:aminotransferase class I/II-fold pyridoxal phosphate-dependent enzyme [Lachnospiraceae bacterium]